MLSLSSITSTISRQVLSPVRSLLQSGAALSSPLAPLNQVRFRYHHLRNRTRVKRDMLRHQAVADFEIPRMVFKAIHRDQSLDMKTRLRAMMTLHSMHNYTRGTALKPRCVETGRGNGIIQELGISRIVFREAAINGKLPGVIQAIW